MRHAIKNEVVGSYVNSNDKDRPTTSYNLILAFAIHRYILSIRSVSNDSVSGQRRPRSDCGYAQSDLRICCAHMPKGSFSLNDKTHIYSDVCSAYQETIILDMCGI